MERFVCCSGNPIDVLSLRLQNRQGQVGKRSIGFMQRPVLSCDVSRLRIDQVWRVERNRKLFVCPGFRFRVYGGQSSGEQSGDISPDDHNIHEDDQNASSFHTDEFYGKEQQEIEETQKRTSMCDDDVRNSRNPSTANHRDSIHASSSISSSGEYEPLAREFENFRFRSGTEGAIKLTKRLELLWSITERKGPELCPDCRGSGEHECEYCHGTGVMTVGDSLFCNQEGCRPCPVCRGTGACQCAACRGTGKRASWLAPVIAVTAAAVGWIMLAFERQSSNRLRKRLEIVEAHCLDFDSKAKHRHLESRDNTGIAICHGKLNPRPRWQEDVEIEKEETLQQKKLMQQIQELCKEFEDEDPNTMLQAEDQALKDLHKELVELRSSIERDIGVKNSNPTIIKTNGDFSEGTSGTTTPAVHTPPGSIVPAFSSSSSIRSGHLELTTPSPSQGGPSIFRAYSSGTPSSAPESIGNLSGKSTPPSPQSPYGSFNFSVSFCSGNHLDNGTFIYSGKARKPSSSPYCSDTMPPLPPRDVAPPPMIDKALQASLSIRSGKDLLDEIGDSSEDDEEWLVKPMDQASGNAISKPTVKPLPKVPKLALSAINKTGAPNGNRTSRDRMRSARGPLTLSVRDGIPCRFEANKAPSTSRKSKLPSTPRSPPELMTARYRPAKISTPRLMKPLNLDKRNLAASFKSFESPRIFSPGLSGMSSGSGSSDNMPASARLSRIPKPHVNDF